MLLIGCGTSCKKTIKEKTKKEVIDEKNKVESDYLNEREKIENKIQRIQKQIDSIENNIVDLELEKGLGKREEDETGEDGE